MIHRKYERTKQVVEGFKKNEEQLKAYIDEYKNKLSRQDQKYQLLKEHAEEKLEEANKEIDNISRSQVHIFISLIYCNKYYLAVFLGSRNSQVDSNVAENRNEGQES